MLISVATIFAAAGVASILRPADGGAGGGDTGGGVDPFPPDYAPEPAPQFLATSAAIVAARKSTRAPIPRATSVAVVVARKRL